MLPGMMPILHSPAVITPGQFGPIRRDFEPQRSRLTLIISATGIPSVIVTMSAISAASPLNRAAYANVAPTCPVPTTATRVGRDSWFEAGWFETGWFGEGLTMTNFFV